jgi:hypothetical protein
MIGPYSASQRLRVKEAALRDAELGTEVICHG